MFFVLLSLLCFGVWADAPVEEDYTGLAELIRNKLWLYWRPSNSSTLDLVLHGRTSGYVAVGFTGLKNVYFGSGKMIGAEAVVGWINEDNIPEVGAYLLDGKETSLIVNSSLNLTNVTGRYEDGFTTIWFSRKFASGRHPLEQQATNEVIGAIGDSKGLQKHTYRSYSFVVDFGDAAGVSYGPDYFDLQGVHLVLMGTSWGIILPFGMLWARFGKNEGPQGCWFQVHRAIQIGGGLIAVAGFIVGLVMCEGKHFRTLYHGQLGVAIMAFFFLQCFAGFFHPTKLSSWRTYWQPIHTWSGRILGFAGLINMYTGVYVISYSLAATAAVYSVYSSLVVIGIIGVFYAEWRHRTAHHFKRVGTNDSS